MISSPESLTFTEATSIVKMRELGGANDRRSDERLGPAAARSGKMVKSSLISASSCSRRRACLAPHGSDAGLRTGLRLLNLPLSSQRGLANRLHQATVLWQWCR